MTEERDTPESAGQREPESTGDPEFDRRVEGLEDEGDRVGQDIEDAKRDWEAKKEDPGVPGAVEAEEREGEDQAE